MATKPFRITVTLDAPEVEEFERARSASLIAGMKRAAVGKAFLMAGVRLNQADGVVPTKQTQMRLSPSAKAARRSSRKKGRAK